MVTDAEQIPAEDLAAVNGSGGPTTPVLLAGPDGEVRSTVTALSRR